MTAFQPTQDAFAFPQNEVAIQLPERGWYPVVTCSDGNDSYVELDIAFDRRKPKPSSKPCFPELMSKRRKSEPCNMPFQARTSRVSKPKRSWLISRYLPSASSQLISKFQEWRVTAEGISKNGCSIR